MSVVGVFRRSVYNWMDPLFPSVPLVNDRCQQQSRTQPPHLDGGSIGRAPTTQMNTAQRGHLDKFSTERTSWDGVHHSTDILLWEMSAVWTCPKPRSRTCLLAFGVRGSRERTEIRNLSPCFSVYTRHRSVVYSHVASLTREGKEIGD